MVGIIARTAAALDQLGDEIVTGHFLPFDRRRGWDQLVERGFGGHGLSGGRRTEIGRAACRDRVGKYVENSVAAGAITKQQPKYHYTPTQLTHNYLKP